MATSGVLVLALCAAPDAQRPAPAAQPAAPLLRVTTEVVVVDLLARDASGRFVDDLRAEEIQLQEDGRTQTIEFVRLIRHADPNRDSDGVARVPPGAPSGRSVQVLSALQPVRVTVVIDLLTTPAEELPRVQDAILRLINTELPDGTEVMLATLWHDISIQQTFTSNKATLSAAVRSLTAPTAGEVGFLEMLDEAQRRCETGAPPVPQLIAMGKGFITEIRLKLANSSAALSTLVQAAAVAPGRKHIVLYSRGYALNAIGHVIELIAAAGTACGGDGSQIRRMAAEQLSAMEGYDAETPLRRLIDTANRSQVSFYVIDPRGLFVSSIQARDQVSARSARAGLASRLSSIDATLPQEYLRTLAWDTGGRAFLNTNDLAGGLRRAWTDATEYYLIGYSLPANRKRGRYHRIEIKLARSDLDLRYRRGYYDLSEQEVRAAEIESALRVPGTYAHRGMNVDVRVDAGKLRVITYLPPTAVTFTARNRHREAAVSLHALLLDSKGKPVGGKTLFGRDVVLRLDDEQHRKFIGSDNAEIPVEVPSPRPGRYRLTVVARDESGWIGARTTDVVVP